MIYAPSAWASQVERDEKLLMRWNARSTDIPFKATDGRVGALLPGSRYITSPNCLDLPEPPTSDRCEVFLCEDGRFGEHDFGRWPQHYSATYPHHGCILRKPMERKDPLRIMWMTVTREEFVEERVNDSSGMGRVRLDLTASIKVQVSALQTEYESVKDLRSLYGSHPGIRPWFHSIVNQMNIRMNRLETLDMTLKQARDTVADLQRFWLDIKAYIYYMLTAKPLMDNANTDVIFPPYKFLGTITDSITVVEEHARAGIPVWLIRPLTTFSNIRIDAVVPPMQYSNFLDLTHDSSQPIFRGRGDSATKYTAMQLFSRNYLSYSHSTGTLIEDAPPPSKRMRTDSSPSSQASSSRLASLPSSSQHQSLPIRTTKIQVPAIDETRFHPSANSHVPPMMSTWQPALNQVVRKPKHVHHTFKMGDQGFPFPDIFNFIPANDEKMAIIRASSAFVTWVTFQSALVHRITESDPTNIRLTSKQWKEALLAAAHRAGQLNPLESSKHGQKLTAMMEQLKAWSKAQGVRLRTLEAEAKWGSETLSVGTLPNEETAREILWEINELNWRFELSALDSYMHQPTDDLDDDRDSAVRMCMPGWKHTVPGGDITTVSCANANTGLSASSTRIRRIYVLNLARLMKTWKDAPAPMLEYLKKEETAEKEEDEKKERLTDSEIELLEGVCARSYCQSFFNRFARAPHVPRYLPHMPTYS
ncbi:hypothetical protein ONZ45_g9252 [Pleurotus djamor]|nr:hypothetical protein ONZ45_g9252 [Pleurotus djamor]